MRCNLCFHELEDRDIVPFSEITLPEYSFAICPKCLAISSLPHLQVERSSKSQALFHELLFGFDPPAFNTYIEDAIAFERVIADDYQVYFGNNLTELICDVGAGRGNILKALHNKGYSAIGCEYSTKLVNAGRAAYGLSNDAFFQLNAWDLPSYLQDRSIKPTVLVFWHVIEHIENSLMLLESIIKVCADRVTIIFQTPLPVPEYVYPEHLFFPSTETYHFLAERLGLTVKLLYVIPYTRFVTCVLSNKDVPQGKTFPKQLELSGFSVIGQLVSQLDLGLQELDQVTKEQFATITRLEAESACRRQVLNKPMRLVSDLTEIGDFLQSAFGDRDRGTALQQKMQQLINENQALRTEMLRADAQLALLKDVFLNKLDTDSL